MMDDESDPNELTIFRPTFEETMLLQKAEEAGFQTAFDIQKWLKLLAILRSKNIAFCHAEDGAAEAIRKAHVAGVDFSIVLRITPEGTVDASA